MRTNRAKELMMQGIPAIGASLAYGSPWCAGEVAQAGYDWVKLDLQHGAWSLDAFRSAVVSITQAGSVPMTRVLSNSFDQINRVLDDGVAGVVVPMVDSREDAQLAARATRYPPLGGRSNASPYLTRIHGDNYFTESNDQVFLAVQIESAQAVENAEAILSVEGVDGCWIGPSDLALSMGLEISDMGNHPRHDEAVDHVLQICKKLGKVPGYACGTEEMGRRRISEGFTFVNIGSDSSFVTNGATKVISEFKG